MKAFASPEPYPYLEINPDHLSQNLEILLKRAENASGKPPKVLIPVKANAYGFGLDAMMPFFLSRDIFCLGVANVQEGVRVRSLGWKKNILNLGSFFPENSAYFFEHEITPTITEIGQIDLLNGRAGELSRVLDIHIKWDTGMGRLGLYPRDYPDVLEKLRNAGNLRIRGIYTHFPRADYAFKDPTSAQNRIFTEIASRMIRDLSLRREDIILHAANSYGVLLHPETRHDMIRPGILFYGYFQSMKDRKKYFRRFPIRGGLTLKARPFSIRRLKAGDTVSYGSSFTASRSMSVGVFPLGYADGIPRAISNRIKFGRHRLLGRVTMDQIILSDVDAPVEIEILGENTHPLEYWAEVTGTISYEILTGLGLRLRRVIV